MRFWRKIGEGKLGTAWRELSRRPDAEHVQALIRVLMTAAVCAYLYWVLPRDGRLEPGETAVLRACFPYLVFSLILFLVILRYPGPSPFRRCLGAAGDLGITSYGIALAGEAGAPMYILLLWVTFGNGLRYGRKYLAFSTTVATVCFGLAISFGDYWRDKLLMGIGLAIGIVMLSLYVASLLKDLTVAARKAEEANRAKSRFLAHMSHEMRTPLNGIIGLIDLLRGTPLTAEQEELARTADTSARTLMYLMQDILDLSKIEAGKVNVQVSRFDLHELAKNTMAIIEPQARAKDLELFLNVDPKVPFLLRGDPLLLRQVLLNLLGNAVKFTERGEVGARVLLETETADAVTVRFEVVDTGIGIPTEAQKRIFDRFAQADESITRRYGGTGLGTTISKEIVEMLGGRIGLYSAPGQGSTFWFTLGFGKLAGKHADAEVLEALADRRALIVSQDAPMAETVGEQLAEWGIRAAKVGRSAQAFAQMVTAAEAGFPFDFAVVVEPGLDMDAFAFARAVESDPMIRSVKRILVTERGEGIEAFVKTGYIAALPFHADRKLLFNAVHLSRPDGLVDSPEGNIADRHRRRHRGLRKLRVLVAEDNRTNQMVIAKILERAGHEVTLACDGEQALEALRSGSFDVTLMDLHMPVMGGVEAARLHRLAGGPSAQMPIVALTADVTPEAKEECAKAGMEDVLTKPIDTRKLFELLDRLLPGSSPGQGGGGWAQAPSRGARPGDDAGSEEEAFDPAVLDELKALSGGDFVVRLIWTFLKGSKEKVRELEQAISAKD
ncbi:MAG: histidine kinase, partial [Deltaproteobacteria bacterium]|nr:histidine kinase [Deltaproteobacteria bacterium]